VTSVYLNSAKDTKDLGQKIGAIVPKGSLILLSGAMGAGKSTLCQGIAQGLGHTMQISSPSFTLLNTYEQKEARAVLNHLDFYNIENLEHLERIGIYDVLEAEDTVCLIEWWEKFPEVTQGLPALRLLLSLYGEGRRLEWVDELNLSQEIFAERI